MGSGEGEGWVAPDVSDGATKRKEIADKLKNGVDVKVSELNEPDVPKEDAAATHRRELRQKIASGELTPNAEPSAQTSTTEMPTGMRVDQHGMIHRDENK